MADGPFPMRPGLAKPGYSYPEYRWVPPGSFQDVRTLTNAPWGQVRPPGMPYPAPAYSVDAPLVCESCGPLGEAQDAGLSTAAALVIVGVAAVGGFFLGRHLTQTFTQNAGTKPKPKPVKIPESVLG